MALKLQIWWMFDLLIQPFACRGPSVGKSLIIDGERGRNRTFNLLIKSQLLCQLSYAPDAVFMRGSYRPAALALARCTLNLPLPVAGGRAFAAATSTPCMAACKSPVVTM
jgi:hypothetical protein